VRACALYAGPADGVCDWCRLGPQEHELFLCPSCHGWRTRPDPADRTSRQLGLPVWAWRRVDCSCRFDDHGIVRTGGVVDRDGAPVDDDRLRAAGILRG